MKELQVFPSKEFGDVRVVAINGEPWFVGKDIATALGYARPDNAVTDKVDKDDRLFLDKKLVLELGIGFDYKELGQRGGWIVSESGMYALIFDSKLESAKKFKRWVTSEVLPEIRKTGTYGTPQLPTDPMELLELHYQAIKQVDSKVNTLEQRFNNFEKSLPLLPNEADEVSNAVKKRVAEVLGGKESVAYKSRGICQRAFMDAYRELKRNFNVARYKDIKREQKAQAVEVAGRYETPLFLKEQIEQANAQTEMHLSPGGGMDA